MGSGIRPDRLVAALSAHYGTLRGATSDPFELVLWENVAYLAPPARRLAAFDDLKRLIGTTPAEILRAKKPALEKVTAHGILKSTFADKLRECAHIARDEFAGELNTALRVPLPQAKRALQLFPGIGEPGAEKILLLAGLHALLAPDSNALRVLVRAGLVADDPSYAKMYAASRKVQQALPASIPAMQQAHLVLQLHGQQLCKRSAPRCGACPLARECPSAAV